MIKQLPDILFLNYLLLEDSDDDDALHWLVAVFHGVLYLYSLYLSNFLQPSRRDLQVGDSKEVPHQQQQLLQAKGYLDLH